MVLTALTVVGAVMTGTGIGGLLKIYGKELDEKQAAKEAEAKAKKMAELKEEYKLAEEMNEEISYAKVADISLELYEAKKKESEAKKLVEDLNKMLALATKEAREYEIKKGIER